MSACIFVLGALKYYLILIITSVSASYSPEVGAYCSTLSLGANTIELVGRVSNYYNCYFFRPMPIQLFLSDKENQNHSFNLGDLFNDSKRKPSPG